MTFRAALGPLAALGLLLAAPVAAQPAPSGGAWLPRGTAELTALDKVRAAPTALTVPVGESVRYGSLTIRVRGCMVRPADQARDAAAFVEVADSQPGGAGFSGWMVANAPALGVLEHPIYDLRVTSCR